MRYAILADIHSNLAAFEAVLKDIEERGGVEGIWCLGDIIGYGPDPHACIELLNRYKHIAIAGNHDWAAIGKLELTDFNPYAAAAARWTAHQLTKEDIKYIENLPLTLGEGDFTLVHGSPRHPIWEYLLSPEDAEENFSHFNSRFCLIGHSHIPFFTQQGEGMLKRLPPSLPLGNERLIINPGGVGQPRDGDPRASYVIYDSQEGVIYHHRIPYDIAFTQRKMVELGLPSPLAIRLSYGR
jgi:predicted phosphodiesterase